MNAFSKVYERYFLNSLSNNIEKIPFNFIVAYTKTYSSSHVIRLIENWKKHLDNTIIVGTKVKIALMMENIRKAFA